MSTLGKKTVEDIEVKGRNVLVRCDFNVPLDENGNITKYNYVTYEEGIYVVEGPRIEKMLGYTNLESEKGFLFFQRFLKGNGILEELKKAGIEEGDTVRMYGLEFDYYK